MSFKKDGKPDLRYNLNKPTRTSSDPFQGKKEPSPKLYDDGLPTVAIPLQYQLIRTLQDIQTYLAATRHAENIQAPNRTNLYRLYRDVVIDAQVSTVMSSRKNAILSRSYNIINSKGDIDLEKTKLLNKGNWLYDFIDYSLDSIFYGYSLIQFDYKYDFMGNRIEYDFKIDVVPREYTCPEYGLVVPAQGQYTNGINYYDAPYKYWNIPVGRSRDLGLLHKLSPLWIWKKNSFSSWAEFTEVFGVPMRIVKTDMTDLETKKNAVNMMKNMGAGGFGIFSREDMIDVLESKSSNGEIFNNIIERCNSEIAKLVLGQTGTIEEKAFVGSAQVHERVLQQYTDRDEKFMENLFQTHLIPFLNLHKFGFEGCSIQIAPIDELSLSDQIKNIIDLSKYYEIDANFIEEKSGIKINGIKMNAPKGGGDLKEVESHINIDAHNIFSEDIPHHPNCQCMIVNDEYIFGHSKSGPCDYCQQAKIDWDNRKKDGRSDRNKEAIRYLEGIKKQFPEVEKIIRKLEEEHGDQ